MNLGRELLLNHQTFKISTLAMKLRFKLIQSILPVLLIGLAACENNNSDIDPNERPATGTPTEIGKPLGAPVTQTIGPAGGTIALPNSRIVFTFPAGVIAQNTPITIQPVENKAFGGVGEGFDIKPKDLELQSKASVTWNYNEEDIDGTAPEALAIAYQNEKGIWQSSATVQVDKEAKTVTAPISRLAHWSFYSQFFITTDKDKLAPGESTILTVRYQEGSDFNDIIFPLNPVLILLASRIVKWTINGNQAGSEVDGDYNLNGQITEDKTLAKAQYDAPPREPDQNPVAVCAYVDAKEFGQLILLQNVTIDSPSFLKVDSNTDNNPMVGLTMHGNSLGGVINDATGTKMLVTFKIQNFKGKGTYEVDMGSTVSITPTIFGEVPYVHGYYKDNKWISG
jgi:hypothetical protein